MHPEHRGEVWEWFFHNIILGLAGFWLPLLFLSFVGKIPWKEGILSGDLAVFAITLSAVSLGFFYRETQVRLRKKQMITYSGLMLVMLVGVAIRTALAASTTFPDKIPLSFGWVLIATLGLMASAVILSYKLFVLEVTLLNREEIKENINQPFAQMAATANEATKAGDVIL